MIDPVEIGEKLGIPDFAERVVLCVDATISDELARLEATRPGPTDPINEQQLFGRRAVALREHRNLLRKYMAENGITISTKVQNQVESE